MNEDKDPEMAIERHGIIWIDGEAYTDYDAIRLVISILKILAEKMI